MREIKFRAFNTDTNKMGEDQTLNQICRTFSNNGNVEGILNMPQIEIDKEDEEFSHLIWLEYTGLKDKNKVEIYDGDILENNQGDIHKVEYHGCQWMSRLVKRKTSVYPAQYLHCEYMGWKVIGNIYDDPKLLDNISKED